MLAHNIAKETKYNIMSILQKVKANRQWVLNQPSFYGIEFKWMFLHELVVPKEDVKTSLIHIQSHYEVKKDFYEPYVRFALDHQLVKAARMEWYGSTGSVLEGLMIPVPLDVEEQKALIDHYAHGIDHPKYGTLHPTLLKEHAHLESQKEQALKQVL